MNDLILIGVVLVIAIGGLVVVASMLEGRRSRSGSTTPELPEPGPVAQILFWIVRILVIMMVLSVIGFFVFKSLTPVWIATGCLITYMIVGRLYQIARMTGK
jgi:heme/copper-type cytochrome/quinol oxidase subunit 2